MNRKTLAAVAVVPLLVGVAAADAAPKARPKPKPKPACNLIKDAKGDATDNGTGRAVATPNDPNLDLLSADVATNATTLTAVFRLASVDGTGNNSPTGRAYNLSFLAKSTVIEIEALVGPGNLHKWADDKGKGTIDTGKKEIRVHVPLSALPVQIKPGDKFTEMKASTWRWVGITPISLGQADNGVATTPYSASYPSCVAVGK